MSSVKSTAVVNAIVLVLLVVINSCSSEKEVIEPQAIPDMHTSEISLDWAGTYQGVLPCADCAGIDTYVNIDYDGTFKINRTYLGKSDSNFHFEGTFKWSEDGSTIILDIENKSAMPYQYFVGENYLIQLDLDGNRINGELAEAYYLEKISTR